MLLKQRSLTLSQHQLLLYRQWVCCWVGQGPAPHLQEQQQVCPLLLLLLDVQQLLDMKIHLVLLQTAAAICSWPSCCCC
jgi:hypothetical protein